MASASAGSTSRPNDLSARSFAFLNRHLMGLAIACLGAPFAVILARYVITPGHIFLSDDLALIDVRVRDALVWKQAVGPWDRYGWNHPGPALFYLLSIPARVVGAGAQAEVAGAAFINAFAALGAVWLVRRQSGPYAALWSASCLVFFAVSLDRAPHLYLTGAGPTEAVANPWNPAVILIPLVLFGVLCASGASGSSMSFLGAVLVGTFIAQTDVSAAPVMGILFVMGAGKRARDVLVARTRRKAGAKHDPASSGTAVTPVRRTTSRRVRLWWCGGVLLFVMAWLPPLVQEVTNNPGNLTKIWRFFTAHHATHSVSHSLQTVASVYGIFTSSGSHPHASLTPAVELTVAAIVLVGVGAVLLGWLRHQGLAVGLGAMSLVASLAAIVLVTRVVGPIHGYVALWAISIPVLAFIGLGISIFGSPGATTARTRAEPRETQELRRPTAAAGLALLAAILSVVFLAQTLTAPSLTRASDPSVETAWQLVAPRLGPPGTKVFLTRSYVYLTNPGWATFVGLFDEVRSHGYEPSVDAVWATYLGTAYFSSGNEPVRIRLFDRSPQVVHLAGYIGHTARDDIVVTYAKHAH